MRLLSPRTLIDTRRSPMSIRQSSLSIQKGSSISITASSSVSVSTYGLRRQRAPSSSPRKIDFQCAPRSALGMAAAKYLW